MIKKAWILSLAALMLLAQKNSFAAFISESKAKADSSVIDSAVNENLRESLKAFNSLSRREQKSKMREVKKAMKDYKKRKKEGDDISTNTLLLIIIAILIPPLAVYLHEGSFNNRFWISVLLTLLGYLLFGLAGILFLGSLPGIIYALYVLLSGA